MRNLLVALAIVVGLWFTRAYAVELAAATDVQLFEQFLLPGATTAQKQKALIGVREMLGLSASANAATCTAAFKKYLRQQIRNAYASTKEDSVQSTVKPLAESSATADLWAPKD